MFWYVCKDAYVAICMQWCVCSDAYAWIHLSRYVCNDTYLLIRMYQYPPAYSSWFTHKHTQTHTNTKGANKSSTEPLRPARLQNARYETKQRERAWAVAGEGTRVCSCYGLAMVSRIDKIVGLFCRISLLFKGSFAKKTYNFIDPTNPSHPIVSVRLG